MYGEVAAPMFEAVAGAISAATANEVFVEADAEAFTATSATIFAKRGT